MRSTRKANQEIRSQFKSPTGLSNPNSPAPCQTMVNWCKSAIGFLRLLVQRPSPSPETPSQCDIQKHRRTHSGFVATPPPPLAPTCPSKHTTKSPKQPPPPCVWTLQDHVVRLLSPPLKKAPFCVTSQCRFWAGVRDPLFPRPIPQSGGGEGGRCITCASPRGWSVQSQQVLCWGPWLSRCAGRWGVVHHANDVQNQYHRGTNLGGGCFLGGPKIGGGGGDLVRLLGNHGKFSDNAASCCFLVDGCCYFLVGSGWSHPVFWPSSDPVKKKPISQLCVLKENTTVKENTYWHIPSKLKRNIVGEGGLPNLSTDSRGLGQKKVCVPQRSLSFLALHSKFIFPQRTIFSVLGGGGGWPAGGGGGPPDHPSPPPPNG